MTKPHMILLATMLSSSLVTNFVLFGSAMLTRGIANVLLSFIGLFLFWTLVVLTWKEQSHEKIAINNALLSGRKTTMTTNNTQWCSRHTEEPVWFLLRCADKITSDLIAAGKRTDEDVITVRFAYSLFRVEYEDVLSKKIADEKAELQELVTPSWYATEDSYIEMLAEAADVLYQSVKLAAVRYNYTPITEALHYLQVTLDTASEYVFWKACMAKMSYRSNIDGTLPGKKDHAEEAIAIKNALYPYK